MFPEHYICNTTINNTTNKQLTCVYMICSRDVCDVYMTYVYSLYETDLFIVRAQIATGTSTRVPEISHKYMSTYTYIYKHKLYYSDSHTVNY